jgi:hypothetical protein
MTTQDVRVETDSTNTRQMPTSGRELTALALTATLHCLAGWRSARFGA